MDINVLKKHLKYCQDSGEFTWLISKRGVAKGSKAGTSISNGCGKTYRVIGICRDRYVAHHLAWLYVYGIMPPEQVDHINGNGQDNRIKNLRLVSVGENKKNLRLMGRNTSGFTGVQYHKGTKKWRAVITVDGSHIHLGLFKDKEDAIRSRIDANKKYGFHENHGQNRPL